MVVKKGAVAAVDWLMAAYNALAAVLWASVLGSAPAAPYFLAVHLLGLSLPWLLARAGTLSRTVALLRHAYPLLWLLPFWSEVDWIRRALHAGAHDALVRSLDVALFGRHLHDTWMPAMPWLWLSELLHFAYFIYYAFVALPVVWLAVRRRYGDLQEASFRLMLAYLACMTSFAFFPVDGPGELEAMFGGAPARGVFYGVMHWINDGGSSLGAAFPSSHVAGAVAAAFVAWRFLPRAWGWVLSVNAALVALATFYTQYHYAIDAAAGAALGIVLQVWVAPFLLRLADREGKMQVAPIPSPVPVGLPVRETAWEGDRG